MFIELDVFKQGSFQKRTINIKTIEDFYPDYAPKNNTTMWVNNGGDHHRFFVKQSYEEVRTLLANVSLLVNE